MLLSQKQSGLYEARDEHDSCGVGAVVNISGQREHRIAEIGKQILLNLHHRGAAGSDGVTGDGAGILLQIPHEFLAAEAERLGFALPQMGRYGVGMVFAMRDKKLRLRCEKILTESLSHQGLDVIGWRDVPTDNSSLGSIALSSEPSIRQFFAAVRCADTGDEQEQQEKLERRLFLARRRAEKIVRETLGPSAEEFYVCSASGRTIVYKGMFMSHQLFAYYPDLSDERLKTALALVHQRYSTNTFPSWPLAQPFRCIAHNGEINTLRGNANQMAAREMKMSSPLLGEDLADVLPVLTPGGSDSACFDNALELLVRAGRQLPHAMMMMIPEAFGLAYHISTDKRAFYEYHASVMEPWDGPAAMVFTDGKLVGGTLDRNGLRPARYIVTTDGLVVLSSEVGVVDIPPENIAAKGRLRPGRMFMVDTVEGRIVTDNEIKSRIARAKPYRRWLMENRIELTGLFASPKGVETDSQTITRRMKIFGYNREQLRMVLRPMARHGQEPVGSMGNDAPLAVLSNRAVSLFAYFRQLFAQVTNPPVDPLREGLVMSLMSYTGRQENLLAETPQHCRQLRLPHPILANEDIERLRSANRKDFPVQTISTVFDATGENPAATLRDALGRAIDQAEQAIRDGAALVILSDRDVGPDQAPIPSLLATSAVHHGLLKRGCRGEAGLVVESGEPSEVMHFCLLCGYGANAVNPYLAFEAIDYLQARGDLPKEIEARGLADNYVAAIKKGILKTMSKMGISTIRSYHAAQLFEAVGLHEELVEEYFTGTSSRISGIGLAEIARDALTRHRSAFDESSNGSGELDFGGEYHFRHDGERHLWNPQTVSKLQYAVAHDDRRAYEEYAEAINNQARGLCTLRGLFELIEGDPVDLDEVEPACEIVKRFCTGAMSHGSISKEAHETMAIAMNRLGGMSNTGEGGEDPARYIPDKNGDSRNCAIKQVASGRFGVTAHYLANAREIQIKMAQGAKPGEGGQLPGHKVTQEIADMRFSTPGVTLISPPPHHDIYSIEDLAQLIYDLKRASPEAKVSVKLVSEVGVGTIAAGVAKGGADEVLISGHDGGTGASPLSSIKHAGCAWEICLAETQQVLVANNLRGRIRVQVDGQLRTGRDVVIGALLGAEQFGFGTAALVTLGCCLMRKCHLGTCPVGIATQDPRLRERFTGKPEHLERFMLFVAEDVRRIMAAMGFRKLEDMVGRVDLLRREKVINHYKAAGLDFTKVFTVPDTSDGRPLRKTGMQAEIDHDHLDAKIMKQSAAALEKLQRVSLEMPIRNVDRTVGATLSNAVVKRHGAAGMPDGTLEVTLRGSAGQSFGAFLAGGITLRLIGDSNDYLGKGLSGGRILVQPPPNSTFEAHKNIIAGNTLLYGATAGEVFINGMAGERFAVRNSGATAVVEGVGDHGCEYMTGGTVVILGGTGQNFAAGMSGGVAYVLDEQQLFDTRCNLDMVDLEYLWQESDKALLHDLISRHCQWTGSARGRYVLEHWSQLMGTFVKVMPIDYRKAIERMGRNERRQSETTPATEEVFHG